MNILFYYPDKEKSVVLSSQMIAFQKQGHKVFLLTQAPEGDLHTDVKGYGVQTFNYPVKKKLSFFFYLKHIRFLISFVKKNKIDIVYSHIQQANLISSIAQYFTSARFILCRHHSDCTFVDYNFNERTADRIINLLGKEFIVPSKKVYDQLVKVEKVKNKKIHFIRYTYDFEQYPKADPVIVEHLKKTYNAKLLLLKVARLIPEKRHILLFQTVLKLVNKGFDIKLLVLSEGNQWDNLKKFINTNNLQNHIFMLGYRTDVMNFIAASDMVVHVSESEASNNFAKEVGLLKKPLIICNDVGDFDEYLLNMHNAIIIDKNNPSPQLENTISAIYRKDISINKLGEELYKTVISRFSIKNLINEYDQLNAERT
jgi:glycosyltransferase involved in cell wall biosynthesis